MPKILFLITKSEFGGAQKYVFELARNLTDFDILVVAGEGDKELFKELNKANIRNIELKYLKRLPNPLEALLGIKEIKKLLKKEKPDILHLNSTTAGILGSIASKNIKTIYTVHGWSFLEPGFLKSKVYFILERLTARYKDKFIVLSNADKKIAETITSKKVIKIPNGIADISFLNKKEARERLNIQGFTVGVIANLYKTKGLKYLIRAINDLNINLVIIGDGRERKRLEKLIKTKNIVFKGRMKEAHQYLKAFDIFCLPSLKEGFPFVILEAMRASLPIIATRVGAIPEIIRQHKEGILIEPKNIKEIKRSIELLIENQGLRDRLGKNAEQRSWNFTLEQTIKQTKQCILSTLK